MGSLGDLAARAGHVRGPRGDRLALGVTPRAPGLGITHILVLDASGDKADTWFTLGGSIALARSDAATEIILNPTTMITSPAGQASPPQLLPGLVRSYGF